ncbi:MAG: hypothetical protein IJL69_01920 [Oscillospiraceae bacterium]|nr:hypothetical protein [Oscillospiraceae bacterium]
MDERTVLRELAERYAVYALDGRSAARKERYRAHNSLETVRPPVLVFEVPWGEYAGEEALRPVSRDPRMRGIETDLRRAIFQFEHFEGDFAVHDYRRAAVALNVTGNGLEIDEDLIAADTGTDILSHGFRDTIPDAETFLAKVKTPSASLDREETERRLNAEDEVFHGILPVKKAGVGLYLASWDMIPRYHGVENCLMDLYDDPEYAHLLIETFTRHQLALMRDYERLNVLDTDPLYLHCTPAATRELPVKDMDREKIGLKDVWARAMAQIFAVVSPEMHEEFDLVYTQRMFDLCGLSYYGCCEPLHNKIDKLRRFSNLRRVSITAWADVDEAAEKIGRDFVLSYKPNPAFVAGPGFDPEPVRAEICRVVRACRRNGTPCEFILKDISTTSGRWENLSAWVDTVSGVLDETFA